ncbi:MAG: DNA-binding protein [Syntrophomonadaceae bacterium]|nr:DNA-binding protein [Syntrophomonadaceae bacterium]
MKNCISVEQGYKLMFCDYPDVVDVDAMRVMLGGIGKRMAYRLLRDGTIESVRMGRIYKVPKISIITYLCKSKVES